MSLTVQLLPTSVGDSSQLQPLTTFLVNRTIAIDAGSLGFALRRDDLANVGHVVLTHTHMDHVASLPIAIAEVFPVLKRPLRIYGTEQVVSAVRAHLFNDVLWPDFAKIKMLKSTQMSVEWVTIREREPIELDGVRLTLVPVKHEVPTVGVIAEAGDAAVVFTSDTTRTDEIWQAAATRGARLKAVFIDCSFPDEFEDLAFRSGHLTPKMVAEESKKLGRPARVMCVHVKPGTREKTLTQIAARGGEGLEAVELGRTYEF
jgi:ribonuclease BN (tRNA processing enzyme)